MKKKYIFFDKDLVNYHHDKEVIKNEIEKAYKIEICKYRKNGKLKLTKEILDMFSFEKIEDEIEEKNVKCLILYYKEDQLPTKRSLINGNIDYKLFEESLISYFDKRKINKCFNYEFVGKNLDEVLNQFLDEYFYKEYGIKKEEKESWRAFFKETIGIDNKLYNDNAEFISKNLIEEIESFKKSYKELSLKIQKKEEIQKKEMIQKLGQKYKILTNMFTKSKSSVDTLLSKKYLVINIDIKEDKIEEILLDESYDYLFNKRRNTVFKLFNENFDKKIEIEKRNKILNEISLLDLKDLDNKELERKLNDGKISKKIKKRLEEIPINVLKSFLDPKGLRYKLKEKVRNFLFEIKEDVVNSIAEDVFDLKTEILKNIFLEILLNLEDEIMSYLEEETGSHVDFIKVFDKKIMERDVLNPKQGLIRVLPSNLIKYFTIKSIDIPKKEYSIEYENKLRKNFDKLLEIISTKKKNLKKKEKKVLRERVENIIDEILETIISNDLNKACIDFSKIIEEVYDKDDLIDEITEAYLEYERVEFYKRLGERSKN